MPHLSEFDDSSVLVEIEATEFAMQLLCPDPTVREYLDKHPAVARGDDAAFTRMARDFHVPLILLGCRIGDMRRKK